MAERQTGRHLAQQMESGPGAPEITYQGIFPYKLAPWIVEAYKKIETEGTKLFYKIFFFVLSVICPTYV